MKLLDLTEKILASYEKIGGINHLTGPNLPSKQGIQNIIDDFESLMFPGFKTEDAIEEHGLPYLTSEKLSRLLRNLSVEVHRSLCYERRINTNLPCGHGNNPDSCRKEAEEIAIDIIAEIPSIREKISHDVEAAFVGDPAAKSREEVILSYPGIEAIVIHRFANTLWNKHIPLIPRLMGEIAHSRTGIDIHPGATIGDWFFIDHGTGVVIGETAIIGAHVKVYQGVTLGALSVKKEESEKKRHPTIADNVTIYAGATILGGKTVIGAGSIIGGNVWLTKSVAPGSLVSTKEAGLVIKTAQDAIIDFQI